MSGSPLHILLVEDNLDHAELVRRNLERLQVPNRLLHVEDGEVALEYIFERGQFAAHARFPKPDLVLLDLRLPKVDGLEVLRQVKSHPKLHRLPVVVLTSSEAESDVAKAYDFHANSFVTKPVEFATFSRLLKELGFYWLTWNQPPPPRQRSRPDC